MNKFRVHHCRFLNYQPQAIQCLSYDEGTKKLAVSRADSSIEIWNEADNWYQERVIPVSGDLSIEALVWCNSQLFAAGLEGRMVEYDLNMLAPKKEVPSYNGAIWCMTVIHTGSTTQIAAGTEEGCVVLFDVHEDSSWGYNKALDKQEGRILSIAWFAGDDLIITGGMDNIRVWNRLSGHAIQRITLARQDKNKETIVWTLAVTSDFTIISGDSCGKTSFWNGNQGTLIQAYQSHQADVLALCVNQEGTSVVSGGVDPQLQHYKYISESNSDWKRWVPAGSINPHSHDVRAITFTHSMVLSGGVDCQLVISSLSSENTKVSKIGVIPQKSLVITIPEINSVLLHYPTKLELWQLGSTIKTSDKNGEVLPLKTSPVNLLQVKAREGATIICCAATIDGKRLAYSDHNAFRMFNLNITDTKIGAPTVTLQRIRPAPKGVTPARCMIYSNSGRILVSSSVEGSIQVITFQNEGATLTHVLPRVNACDPIHLLAISPDDKFLAAASLDNNIKIYQLSHKNLRDHCSLPKYQAKPMSVAFSASSTYLVVAYSSKNIMEFNILEQIYTNWSRDLNKSRWLQQKISKISNISRIWYNPCNEQQIFFHTDQKFCILEKTIPSAAKGVTTKASRRTLERALKTCSRYKYIIHMDNLSDDFLVAVEMTPLAIMNTLPPVLKQKKFGT